MKSYVESTLLPDERPLYRAKIHWAIYIKTGIAATVALLAFAGALAAPTPEDTRVLAGFGSGVSMIAALLGLGAFIERATTEMVITNKRVVAKFGFIRRQTFEPNLSQTEGANLSQSLLGRLLGYGEVRVTGTGGSGAPVPFVDNPLAFRNALANAVTINR